MDAYVRAALASDPTSGSHSPACFRAPSGALEDSFYLATGRQLWDAGLVTAHTLVLRSEYDFWSRPQDPQRLVEHLTHARSVRNVEPRGPPTMHTWTAPTTAAANSSKRSRSF